MGDFVNSGCPAFNGMHPDLNGFNCDLYTEGQITCCGCINEHCSTTRTFTSTYHGIPEQVGKNQQEEGMREGYVVTATCMFYQGRLHTGQVDCGNHRASPDVVFGCLGCLDAHDMEPADLEESVAQPTAPPSILEEAQRLVHGNRGEDYGHPLDDFTCTAQMIDAILHHKGKLKEGEHVTAEDIPLIMECVKISRECNRPKRDNRTDGAGYWETLQMVHDEQDRRGE